jgi:hypothetical protein
MGTIKSRAETRGDMEPQQRKFRRGMMATTSGLAIMASLGSGGAGADSAAVPALHIKNGSQWTAEVNDGGGCEVNTFSANHTFRGGSYGDAGMWRDGGSRITMTWTAGYVTGLTFTGTFTKTPTKEYVGNFGGITAATGQLVKGVVSSWDGFTC